MNAPPHRLPDGFADIWRTLADADRRAANRQALAKELGIGTHTLQRILVTGDVPDFGGAATRREVHAWSRTLARIARHVGKEPRDWIEQVGIEWSNDIADVIDRGRGTDRRATRVAPRDRDVVRIGLLPYNHFGERLAPYGRSFLHVYAERLVRSVHPRCRVEVVPATIGPLIEGLTSEPPSSDLVAALFDTVERRAMGLSFIAIPGWEVSHTALSIRRASVPSKPWSALVGDPSRTLFVVLDRQAAHSFLSVQAGIPDASIHALHPKPTRDIALVAFELAREHSELDVVFVNEEESCLRAMARLAGSGRLDGFVVQ